MNEPVIASNDWDPLSPENAADAPAVHAEMRERCPVAHSEQFGGFWSLFNYDDIVAAARDTATYVSAPTFSVPKLDLGFPWIPLQSDPPLHRQYRGMLNPFFLRSRLEGFEPKLRDLTVSYMDSIMAVEGPVDIAQALNVPLPAAALCMLMGRPVEHAKIFHQWVVELTRCGRVGDMEGLGELYEQMSVYAQQWAEESRANPSDDLMSALVAAEVDGRPLSDAELNGMFVLTANAGHETVSNTLGCAMVWLAEHPEDLDTLASNPDLMPTALEEFVRYAGAVQGLARTTTRDVQVGERDIPAGSEVVLMFGSGSRDEKEFEAADRCVLDRAPNHHLGFGIGAHRCIGEHLARIELRVVLEEFVKRVGSVSVIDSESDKTLWPAHGYHSLTVELSPRTSVPS